MQTLPDEHDDNKRGELDWEHAERELEEVAKWLARATDVLAGPDASLAKRERALLLASNEACRRNLTQELESRAQAFNTKYLRADGKLYKRHQEGSAHYHSLCGSMHIRRPTYRAVGDRNGPTIVPLELAAGLIANATPALAYRVALGDAQCPGRQWEQQMVASLREPPSRSTLEPMAKTIGTAAQLAMPVLEPLVRKLERLPEQAHAIALGLDRTTVPMEEPRLGSRDPYRKRRKKPYVRRKPAPIEVNYRMAYVGTVTLSDAQGTALATFRYSASAEEGPARVVASMMADLQHAQQARRRQHRGPLVIGVVQDAAPELWSLLEAALRDLGISSWHPVIDRFHLTERLALALQLLPMQKVQREQYLERWRLDLERDDRAIDRIQSELKKRTKGYWRMCTVAHRQPVFADQRTLDEQLNYIRNHKSKMRYASARALGLPTASGTTEGACKSLVMIRAKRCGQRWHARGVNSVLALRSYYMSERLPAFWSVFAAHHQPQLDAA